ncbi:uncharacterized protein [Dermacentor albipictus]|uniref:uncharacterized protein n=1 Tax=Dermacentor albipictus TaxID=60249 RepID=UPI0031FCBDFC
MDRTDYDTAFSCPVCLGPSQSMVFGLCQHFVCSSCLYDRVEHDLNPALRCCPICKAKNVFPEYRPDIPDANKKLLNIAGVVKCPRKRCGEEMWTWDAKEHEKSCRGLSRRTTGRCSGSPGKASTSRKSGTRQSKRRRSKSTASVRD